MDDEAEVGTTSEDEPMDNEESSAKKKKRAMISSDESEDEDEDEDKIRKEMKGFVVVSIWFFRGAICKDKLCYSLNDDLCYF